MSLFKDFWEKLQHLLGIIPAKVKEYASQSLAITTSIKNFLSSPVADVITALIPGAWDDKLKETVLKALEEVLPYLTIVDTCKDQPDVVSMLNCWITEVRKQPVQVQNALLHKLASLLTAKLDNQELKQNQYDYYIQLLYSGNKTLKP